MSTSSEKLPVANRPEASAVDPAVDAVLGAILLTSKALAAYGREDLVARVAAARQRVEDPDFRVLVVGEFKQGKSSLVNALLDVDVCPVDDDIATSAPTAVRYDEQRSARVLYKPSDDDPDGKQRSEEIDVDRIREIVTEATNPANERRRPVARDRRAEPAARGRARARRHARRRRPRIRARGDHGGRAPDGRRRAVPHRRVAGVLRAGDDLPEAGGVDVPERLLRAHEDRLLPGMAEDPRARPGPPAERGCRDGDPARLVGAAAAGERVRGRQRSTRSPGSPSCSTPCAARSSATGRAGASSSCATSCYGVLDQLAAQFRSEEQALAKPEHAAELEQGLQGARAARRSAQEPVGAMGADARRRHRRHHLGRRPRSPQPPASDHTRGRRGHRRGRPGGVLGRVRALALPPHGGGRRVLVPVAPDPRRGAERAGRRALRDRLRRRWPSVPTSAAAGSSLTRAQANASVEFDPMTGGQRLMTGFRGRLHRRAHVRRAGLDDRSRDRCPARGGRPADGAQGAARRAGPPADDAARTSAKNALRKYVDEAQFLSGKESRDTLRALQRQLRDHYTARRRGAPAVGGRGDRRGAASAQGRRGDEHEAAPAT